MMSLCLASVAMAHDLGVDVSVSGTRPSANNPRSGMLGVGLSGGFDVSDAFNVWAGFGYTRDLATQAGDATSDGSNIFLLTAGAMYLPTESFSLMVNGSFSPTVSQRSALTLGTNSTPTDTVLVNTSGSLGVGLSGGYQSAGESNWEHAVDVNVGLLRFSTSQKAELPNSVRGNLLKTRCAGNPTLGNCELVNGVMGSLAQVRVGATYTAFLYERFTAGVDGAVYLYDSNPLNAGVYAVVIAGRTVGELGNGVPVAPLLFSVKPFGSFKTGRFALKVGYQGGLYFGAQGSNHVLSVRPSFKVTEALKVTLNLTGQADVGSVGLENLGGSATVSAMYVW